MCPKSAHYYSLVSLFFRTLWRSGLWAGWNATKASVAPNVSVSASRASPAHPALHMVSIPARVRKGLASKKAFSRFVGTAKNYIWLQRLRRMAHERCIVVILFYWRKIFCFPCKSYLLLIVYASKFTSIIISTYLYMILQVRFCY